MRLLVTSLAVAATLAASACGGAEHAARAPAVTTVDARELLRRGVLRVCADPATPPYVARRAGRWDGFEVAVLREAARRASLRVVLVGSARARFVAELEAGRCDAAVGRLRVTYEDQSRIGILAYVTVPLAFLVSAGERAPAGPCAGPVAVVLRTEAEEETRGCRRVVVRGAAEAVRALRAGRVDAVLDDAVTAQWYARRAEGLAARPAQGDTRYGIGYRIRRNSVFFGLRAGLLEMHADGTFRRLQRRYGFGAAKPLGIP